jgi:hypothetical protein
MKKMFSLKPLQISATFICPDCKCKFGQAKELIFVGTSIVADCLCECCENNYYHTLPTGHAALFPVAFSQKTDKSTYDPKTAEWFARPLIGSIRSSHSIERKVSKKIIKEFKEIILLNCLDSCYGHVLLKLFNAQKYIREFPAKGLVVLIPRNFQWLMPEGVAEIWEVEAKLSDFHNRILNLDRFVKEEIKRFDSVLVSEVPVHPDIHQFELKEFFKTEKFNLTLFENLSPTITFILREDRFWLNSRLDAFLFKLSVSKGWQKLFKNYFVARQNSLVRQLAKKIHTRTEKKVTLIAAGIGTSGSLGALVKDQRKDSVNEQIEKDWCQLYAESHLVIGVHGSNMLIPTALAAGFIELLPRHKIYNLSEDIAMDHKGRYMHFLGRFLDEFSSVNLIAEHAVSMINWFPVVRRNMENV